jgi:hypothetical protein
LNGASRLKLGPACTIMGESSSSGLVANCSNVPRFVDTFRHFLTLESESLSLDFVHLAPMFQKCWYTGLESITGKTE